MIMTSQREPSLGPADNDFSFESFGNGRLQKLSQQQQHRKENENILEFRNYVLSVIPELLMANLEKGF